MKNFKKFMEDAESSEDQEQASDKLSIARKKFANAQGKSTSKSTGSYNVISKGGANMPSTRYIPRNQRNEG
tara:strand:+ start:314 stop:526 length:213 start_codon:yes stop_codon:yes gene_type:complete